MPGSCMPDESAAPCRTRTLNTARLALGAVHVLFASTRRKADLRIVVTYSFVAGLLLPLGLLVRGPPNVD